MTPEEALEHLKSITSKRSHRSLEAIYTVCQEQLDRGLADFSYAAIARLGSARGVPKAQSIRNKTGEPYRMLIQSFAANTDVRKPLRKPRKADDWIDEIKDPKLKLLVSVMSSELREAKQMLREIVPPNLVIRVDDRKYNKGEYRLSDRERYALEYLQSEEFLGEFGYHIGDRDDVLDDGDNHVFKPGTISALRKALEFL